MLGNLCIDSDSYDGCRISKVNVYTFLKGNLFEKGHFQKGEYLLFCQFLRTFPNKSLFKRNYV